jgi:DNA-directed RNA polymerase specialized sigma24 family protein
MICALRRMLALVADAGNRRFELLAMPHLDAAFSLARGHLSQSGLADLDWIDLSLNPETVLLDRAGSETLDALVTQMPAEYREAPILREIEDLSYKDIAAVLCIPTSTMMARLSHAGPAMHMAWLNNEKQP